MLSSNRTTPKPTGYLFNMFTTFENTENYETMSVLSLLEANKDDPSVKPITEAFTNVLSGGLFGFLKQENFTEKFFNQIGGVLSESSEALGELVKVYEGEE